MFLSLSLSLSALTLCLYNRNELLLQARAKKTRSDIRASLFVPQAEKNIFRYSYFVGFLFQTQNTKKTTFYVHFDRVNVIRPCRKLIRFQRKTVTSVRSREIGHDNVQWIFIRVPIKSVHGSDFLQFLTLRAFRPNSNLHSQIDIFYSESRVSRNAQLQPP